MRGVNGVNGYQGFKSITWIPGCDCPSSELFYLSVSPSISSTVAFSSLGNSDHAVVSFTFL